MATNTAFDNNGRYPGAVTAEDLRRNIDEVRGKIEAACRRSSRDPLSVRLLPVSKTIDEERIRLCYAVGCRQFGENKVQEAYNKWQGMSDLTDIEWSVIGHLQTNKARQVAKFAGEFQALDSERVAAELDRRLQAEGRSIDVFVQVNTSGEESKYGLSPSDVRSFVKTLPAFTSLKVRGLMTLALFSDDYVRVRACFTLLRSLRDQLRDISDECVELSMGMSGDYEIAVEEGATVVRVGQAIFGARALPDSHYWPTR